MAARAVCVAAGAVRVAVDRTRGPCDCPVLRTSVLSQQLCSLTTPHTRPNLSRMWYGPQASGNQTARQLLQRLLGDRAAEFTAGVVPVGEGHDVGGPDWFEVDTGPGGVVLRGSSGVAVASALRWYLRTACRTQITWDAPVPRLPDRLPRTGTAARTTSPTSTATTSTSAPSATPRRSGTGRAGSATSTGWRCTASPHHWR